MGERSTKNAVSPFHQQRSWQFDKFRRKRRVLGKESILSRKDLIVFEKRRSVLGETPRRFGGNAETVAWWVFLTILVKLAPFGRNIPLAPFTRGILYPVKVWKEIFATPFTLLRYDTGSYPMVKGVKGDYTKIQKRSVFSLLFLCFIFTSGFPFRSKDG